MRAPSIRSRLLGLSLPATVAAWLILLPLSYLDTREDIAALYDTRLRQSAEVLLALVRHELSEPYLQARGADGRRVDKVMHAFSDDLDEQKRAAAGTAFQIILAGETRPILSTGAPRAAFVGRPGEFSEQFVAGKHWRVFTLGAPGEATIHVAETLAAREDVIGDVTRQSLSPLIVLLPLLGIIIWAAVGHSLRPLNDLAGTVATRAPDDLRSLALDDIPVEVRPLVESLNQQFARLRKVLDSERRFAADAAHELRTPLAAIRTQAQVAARVLDAEGREQALRAMTEAVDRTAHLIDQLLNLARLDTESAATVAAPFDVGALLRRQTAMHADMAKRKDVRLSLHTDAASSALGSATLAEMAIRNLLDNAIRYTPSGGQVRVAVRRVAAGIEISICDTGPGIPEELRDHSFERFNRLNQPSGGGAGLGLSIVRRIAEIDGATVALDHGDGCGLRARLLWPSA